MVQLQAGPPQGTTSSARHSTTGGGNTSCINNLHVIPHLEIWVKQGGPILAHIQLVQNQVLKRLLQAWTQHVLSVCMPESMPA